MENLKKLYAKDIQREIQGVIKVDDESYVSQELEEYVVTDELLKHFHSFFDLNTLARYYLYHQRPLQQFHNSFHKYCLFYLLCFCLAH